MSKRRMPPNLAWPCSRAALAGALGTDMDLVDVSWWIDGGDDRDNLLYADWNSRRFPYGEPPITPSTLSVVVRPIPKTRQAQVRHQMTETGLPDLARWVAAAFAAPATWQDQRHLRKWTLVGDDLIPQEAAGAAVVDRQFWR